jgi:putative flippase GtrA
MATHVALKVGLVNIVAEYVLYFSFSERIRENIAIIAAFEMLLSNMYRSDVFGTFASSFSNAGN